MAKDLRVDPADMQMAADHVDVAAEDLRLGHASAHERIGAAQAGWIGASAAALAARAAKWEQESTTHYEELVGHLVHFRSAATAYVTTDSHEASDIDSTIGKLSADMGL